MANNFRRLKEEADIEQVVNALGIKVVSKGSAKFILCPLPEHDDKNATNCYFKTGWNNVLCKTCGKAIQAIDLIMYTNGLSYGKAADLLWEIEGKPDWYYDRKTSLHKESFSISGKEAKTIGIYLPYCVERPVRYSDIKEVNEGNLPKNQSYSKSTDGYLTVRSENITWRDFASERDMKRITKAKCEEALERFDQIEARLNLSLFEEERGLINELKKRCT